MNQRMTFCDYVTWHTEAKDFLEDPPITAFLKGIRVDHFICFEELPNSFENLFGVDLPHVHKLIDGEDWGLAYDEEIAAKVYKWALSDFVEFGYGAESWRCTADVPIRDS